MVPYKFPTIQYTISSTLATNHWLKAKWKLVTCFKTTYFTSTKMNSLNLDQVHIPCCKHHETNMHAYPSQSGSGPVNCVPGQYATWNELFCLNWYQRRSTSLAKDGEKCWRSKVAAVHILQQHSCTVVCNHHCVYYSQFCVNLFCCKYLLVHRWTCSLVLGVWDIETCCWPIRLLDFLQLCSNCTHTPCNHNWTHLRGAQHASHSHLQCDKCMKSVRTFNIGWL